MKAFDFVFSKKVFNLISQKFNTTYY